MPLHALISSTLIRHSTRGHTTAATRQQIRNAKRGGQNLSNRYARLELSLRGKTALGTQKEELEKNATAGPPRSTLGTASGAQTFRGIVIPRKPREPASDGECDSFLVLRRQSDPLDAQNAACLGALSAYTTCTRNR